MVFPVVLGSGKRLFGETSDKHSLKLTDSKIVGDGVAILTYVPAARLSGRARPRRSSANSVIASASSSGASDIGVCPIPRM